jgi:hypothetical protein
MVFREYAPVGTKAAMKGATSANDPRSGALIVADRALGRIETVLTTLAASSSLP